MEKENEQMLVLRDNAKSQLMEIKTIESGKEYLNKVKAIEVWAKAEKKDAELQNIIAEQKIRTQRILGQLIIDGQENGEIRTQQIGINQYKEGVIDNDTHLKLSDIGITRNESSQFKIIANIPEEIFEQQILQQKAKELTTSGILNISKILKRKENIEQIKNNPITTPEGLYDVIVIDLPWNYEEKLNLKYDSNKARGYPEYPTMTIKEIKELKLPASEHCVLFLWTTQKFLPDSFELLKHYGFQYRVTLVWNKVKMGLGRTLRQQCEFCLLGVKGNPIIQGENTRDIITEERREHSRKPEAFYNMVDEITIGRKLDYFSREQREGWDAYGIETNKFVSHMV